METKEVLILNKKIDRIMEKVYSVNESLSISEKRELILGFEDGINELFGGLGTWAAKSQKFVTGMGQKAKQAYTDMVNKGKQYYEKGKELAGQAWESIQSFAKGVVDKFKEAYAKASELVVNNYVAFKETVTQAYRSALKSITDSYQSMKDKAQAFAEACKGIWSDILEETSLLIQSTREKMIAQKEGISKWAQSNKQEIQKNIEITKSSTIDSLKSLGEMALTALSKGKQVAGDLLCIATYICICPIVKLIEGLKAIPGVYDSAIQISKEFINKEIGEIKTNYQTEMSKESLRFIQTFENFKY